MSVISVLFSMFSLKHAKIITRAIKNIFYAILFTTTVKLPYTNKIASCVYITIPIKLVLTHPFAKSTFRELETFNSN